MLFRAGTFNFMTSIVANGCLLDNQKYSFSLFLTKLARYQYENYPTFLMKKCLNIRMWTTMNFRQFLSNCNPL